MKKIVATTLWMLFSASPIFGTQVWEYQVVYLPGTMDAYKVLKQPHGGYLDPVKTDILNKIGADGWEVISVTGDSGADHAVYLRRPKGGAAR